jgi:hypothetical protein
VDIITQELQGEAYDEGVLSELDSVTALLRVFDQPKDLAGLVGAISALDHLRGVDGLRGVELVNTNMGKLQDWFNNTFAQTSASITTQVSLGSTLPPPPPHTRDPAPSPPVALSSCALVG